MPPNIVEIFPSFVRKLLRCDDDLSLTVVRNLHVVDLFAGKARVARWSELLGLKTAALDRAFGSHLNLCTDEGLAITICTILRVRAVGLVMMGPQCSSWVWLSRSVTRRRADHPYGDDSLETVREGNLVNERVALLCAICSMLGIAWIVEQPSSSLFFHTNLMRCVKSKENPWFRHFFMKDFGHSAKKPTILMGVAPLLSALGTAFKPKEGPKRKKTEKKTKRCAADAKHKTEKRTKGRAKPSKAKPNRGQDTPGEALCTVKVNPITGKKVVTGKREKVSWLLWKLLHWQIVIFVGFFFPDEIKLHSSNAQVKASQVYPPKFALRIVAGHFPDCVSQH